MPTSSTGSFIRDGLPECYTYTADGKLETVTITDGTKSWQQTYTYADGLLRAKSGWVQL